MAPQMGSDLDPRFTRHVDAQFPRDDLGTLLDAAEAAQALAASAGWALLTSLLEAEVRVLDVELDADRPLDSRADYAALLGRRGGLKAPQAALQALISRAESRLVAERERQSVAESAHGST